jgi:hypothetical protein
VALRAPFGPQFLDTIVRRSGDLAGLKTFLDCAPLRLGNGCAVALRAPFGPQFRSSADFAAGIHQVECVNIVDHSYMMAAFD